MQFKDWFLCVIHDKMDDGKFYILKASNYQQNDLWAWLIAHHLH
jgi:hypothetical protein